MAPPRLLSDLVRDSKIGAKISGASTTHVFYTPGRSARERQVRKEEQWMREVLLGQGAFGTVYRERCEEPPEDRHKLRAVKEIKKHISTGEGLDYTRELETIVKFSHPKYLHCFVCCNRWFESPESVFIIMEYLELGDLQKHITRPFSEREARDITAQILEGVRFMHENDFVHRDLKPQNIMVVSKDPEWFVKIADFGISKRRIQDVATLHTMQRGTISYAAPEVFGLGQGSETGSYTCAVDMWSLGAVVNTMLTKKTPFQGLGEVVKYVSGALEFPVARLEAHNVSEQGRDFVVKLMSPDPKTRLSVTLAASHPWMSCPLPTVDEIRTEDERTDISGGGDDNHFPITEASGVWTSTMEFGLPIVLAREEPVLSGQQPPSESSKNEPVKPDHIEHEYASGPSVVSTSSHEQSTETTMERLSLRSVSLRVASSSRHSSSSGSLDDDVVSEALSHDPNDDGYRPVEDHPPSILRPDVRRNNNSNDNPTPLVTCHSCLEKKVLAKTVKLDCSHRLCFACLKAKFERSIKDTNRDTMPPRCCCPSGIPFKHAERLFDPSFKQKFDNIYVQFLLRHPVNCAAGCRTHIRPRDVSILDDRRPLGTCSRSHAEICLACKGRWHKFEWCPFPSDGEVNTRDPSRQYRSHQAQQPYSVEFRRREGTSIIPSDMHATTSQLGGTRDKRTPAASRTSSRAPDGLYPDLPHYYGVRTLSNGQQTVDFPGEPDGSVMLDSG